MATFVSLIFLSGGKGERMQNSIPKQYLKLRQKEIALYSFETLQNIPEIKEIIVVCDPLYCPLFQTSKPLIFASPGARRQDSLLNGLLKSSPQSQLLCIHDAARPLVDQTEVQKLFSLAEQFKAAALGAPVTSTIKICQNGTVLQTPDRANLWEVFTPQVVQKKILEQSFAYLQSHNSTVTDDLSLTELLGFPGYLLQSKHKNLKITTPIDLKIAEALLETL